MKSIAVLAGYWSTNIGNAFFQLGAQAFLQKVLPDADVFLIGDEPGYWNVGVGNPRNALAYVQELDVDAVVFLGPMFRPEFPKIAQPTMRALADRGVKVVIMAAGMMQYDPATVEMSRRLIGEVRPYIFTTRDRETYEALGDLAEHAYDGIDTATYVTDVFPKRPTRLPPYAVVNFDQIPEPTIAVGAEAVAAGRNDFAFDFDGSPMALRFPRWRTALYRKSRAYPFLEAMLRGGEKADRVGPLSIVRTDHRYNPFSLAKGYRSPRTYAGDVPHSYLSLYANSSLTLSNRVHACVATLSYGNPAMLISKTPRARLLSRLGVAEVTSRPVTIDQRFLSEEKSRMEGWFRSVVRGPNSD